MDINFPRALCHLRQELDLFSTSDALYDEIGHVYRAERARLARQAARITRDPASAEDVVQEAFVRACERAMTVPPPRLKRWMNTVVQHLAIDHARRDATRIQCAAMLRWCSSDSLDPPRSNVWAWLTADDVYGAIARLPSRMQPVLRLWCAGASYAAIAAAQRLPLGTVATRVRHARQHLRMLLLEAARLELDACDGFSALRYAYDDS
jgi:RNA polymerase sigma-70 factor (ECF subfamily)